MTKNRSVSYISFPNDVNRCKKWIENCEIEIDIKMISKKQLKVCGEHFETKMFLNEIKNSLQPHALPTVIYTDKAEAIDNLLQQYESENLDGHEVASVSSDKPCTSEVLAYPLNKCLKPTITLKSTSTDTLAKVIPDYSPALNPLTSSDCTLDFSSGFSNRSSKGVQTLKTWTNKTPREILLCQQLKTEKEGRLVAEKAVIALSNELAKLLGSSENVLKLCEKHLSPGVLKVVKSSMLCKTRNLHGFRIKTEEDNMNEIKEESSDEGLLLIHSDIDLSVTNDDVKKEKGTDSPIKTEIDNMNEIKEESSGEGLLLIHSEIDLSVKNEDVKEEKGSDSPIKIEVDNTNEFKQEHCSDDGQHLINLSVKNEDAKEEKEIIFSEQNSTCGTKHIHGYLCDICKSSFPQKSSLINHMKFNHANIYSIKKQPECPIGDQKSNLIILGRNSIHQNYACKFCQKRFFDKTELNKHTRVHTGEKPFSCDICQKCLSSKGHLSMHLRIHTGEKPFTCDVCQKGFISKSGLVEHARVHTGEKPFACDICQMCFSSRRNFSRHLKVHTGEKHTCDVCQRGFSDKSDLNRHARIHSGEKPFVCDVCQKCFSQKYYLSVHARVHTREKPYACDICQKCISSKSNLSKHLRVHAGKKPFICDVCQKGFSDKEDLNKHARVHIGEKRFACDVCQKSFRHKSSLSVHARIHTGEKPYACDVCLKCFSRNGYLSVHARAHTREKPYACDICQKCFGSKSNLYVHARTHTKEKPF